MLKYLKDLKDLVEFLYKNPLAVFVLLSIVFGYLYFIQNTEINKLSLEVGGLRTEQQKMNEIILLKTKIIELSCED